MAGAATAPPAPTRLGPSLRVAVACAAGIAVCLVAALAVSLLTPGLGGAARVVLGVLALALAVSQVTLLLPWLRTPPPAAGAGPAPRSPAAESTARGAEVGSELQALLATSGRTDEVDVLVREFTRILEILQQQAAQVQEYAARFEAMNEELRSANLRLREMSLTDELTEIGNRRNFQTRMREEINRSTRFGHTFSLILLDIDAFKKFNDEYGHPQGDVVLRALGALMRSMSREGDVPCRIGGEEFAFILPETGKQDAMRFAERIRRGVEATIRAPGSGRALTVSLGLAAFPEDGKTEEELLRAADEALYQSKREGRNRVTMFVRKG